MEPINPDDLRFLQSESCPEHPRKPRIPRHRKGEWFLKGPIPWNWLVKAGQLPGKALHVAQFIWLMVGMKRSAHVGISLSRVSRDFHFSRASAIRGLRSLEKRGLVSVSRGAGRKPIVTVLEPVAGPQLGGITGFGNQMSDREPRMQPSVGHV